MDKTKFNFQKNKLERFVVGKQGDKGDKGDIGPSGPKGETGAIGPVGPKGDNGKDGLPGQSIIGPKGDKGDKGDTGERGPKGVDGIDGKNGIDFSNKIHRLNSAPKSDFGKEGDWAFTETNEIFFKKDNRWVFVAQINSGYSKKTIVSFIRDFMKSPLVDDLTLNEYLYANKTIIMGPGSSAAGGAPLKFSSGSLLSSPESGAIEYYDGHLFITDGARHAVSTCSGVKTSSTTISNSVVETTIYSYQFAANELHADQRVLFTMDGIYSAATNSDSFIISVKLNGTLIHSITRVSKGTLIDVGWELKYSGTIRTSGSSGTFIDFMKLSDNDSSTAIGDTTNHSINTTIPILFDVTVTWLAAKTGNSFTCNQGDLRFHH